MELNLGTLIYVQTKAKPEEKPDAVKLPEDFELLTEAGDEWMRRAWSYVVNRGVSNEQIHQHGIGLSLMGRYRARVLFPITQKSRLLGFSGRTLTNIEPKWLHSTGLRSVYPALAIGRPDLVLVEGIFDALVVERYLGQLTDVIALLGTHLSEEKLKWVDSYERITLWLDPDKAGIKATHTIANELTEEGKKVFYVASQKEPADLSAIDLYKAYRGRERWNGLFAKVI